MLYSSLSSVQRRFFGELLSFLNYKKISYQLYFLGELFRANSIKIYNRSQEDNIHRIRKSHYLYINGAFHHPKYFSK